MHSPHHTYITTLVNKLSSLASNHPTLQARLLDLKIPIIALSLLELEPARPLLARCYAPLHFGAQKPHDPVVMLRFFLLMAFLRFTSFHKWAKYIKNHPEIPIIAGFEGASPPGTSTFYDFVHRIFDGEYKKNKKGCLRPSERFRGSRNRFPRQLELEKAKREQGFSDSTEGKVWQTVTEVLSRFRTPLPDDFSDRINELLFVCAVVPSSKRGFLGDLNQLVISGDGSVLPSRANGRGKRFCNCPKEKARHCQCERTYSDPDATWGWDSYRQRYIFGHRIHAMCMIFEKHDFPLQLMCGPAHCHDSMKASFLLEKIYKNLRKYIPYAKIEYCVFDAGYDATAIYKLIRELKAKPIITLNSQNTPKVDPKGFKRNEKGIPLCPGDVEFRRHCEVKRQQKVIYACPAKRKSRAGGKYHFVEDLERCPLGELCDPNTTMGPIVNLYYEENPRMNVEVERGSKKFEELYKQRASTERFFSRLEERGLKSGCYHREHLFLFQAMCEGVVVHSKVWAMKSLSLEKLLCIEGLLSSLLAIANSENNAQT